MRLLRLNCVLSGHDDRIVRTPPRMFLECAECGRTTAGWNLNGVDPTGTEVLLRSSVEWRAHALMKSKAAWHAVLTLGARVMNALTRRDPTVARM